MEAREVEIRKEFCRKTDYELWDQIERLRERKKILDRRAKLSGTDEEEMLLADMRIRLDMIRSEYVGLRTDGHPSAVIAKLSEQQGREREILSQLAFIKNAKDQKEIVDSDLHMCENILRERQEQ